MSVGLLVVPLAISAFALGRLRATGPGADWTAAAHQPDLTARFLVAVVVVLGTARLAGRLVVLVGQPPVVGEICVGIALGPSLLGRLSPELAERLFPPAVLPMLNALAQLGLALFMFGVGRELSTVRLREAGSRALLVTQSSLAVPFAAGTVVALGLGTGYLGPAGNRLAFGVFLGCALSITAFPVLARILDELGLTRSRVGRLSLLAAAVGDAGAWLALAAAVALVQGPGAVGTGFTLSAGLVTAVLYLGPLRRLLALLAARWAARPASGGAALPVVLPVCLTGISAALTAAIGLHAAIGAFLAGVVFPGGSERLGAAADRLTGLSAGLLLPFFFLGFGLSVDLGALPLTAGTLWTGAVLLLVAVATKLLGPGLCARLTGMSWRDSIGLGVLLNARGLTELVVLGIGRQAGIIDARMFTILTLVTLVTTVLPVPVLRLLGHAGRAPGAAPDDPSEATAEPAGAARSH
ncbi:cation:proton antiporter [Kitasatospora cystarginea]|uniref:cation:proton antiporter n=1 Tax=Kitasatospora cystarginea TaxID=58350 RepID=UPI0031D4108B